MLLAILLLLGQTCEWDMEASFSRADNVSAASGGTFMAATPGGVYRFDPVDESFSDFYSYPDELPGLRANDVLEDSQGNVWVAPSEGGLAGLIDGEWNVFTVYEGIPGSGAIYSLDEAGGKIWAGTDAGLAMESGDGFVGLDASSTGGGLPTTEIYDLTHDDEYLWLATGRGVYRLDLAASPYVAGSWDSPGSTMGLGITRLTLDDDGNPAAVGSNGLYLNSGGDLWTLILDNEDVSQAAFTSWGLLASTTRVLRYDADSTWVPMGTGFPEGVVEDFFAGPLLELEGTLWCGIGPSTYPGVSWGLGLGRLEGPDDSWEVVTVPGIPACNLSQVTVEDSLTILGSRHAGLLVGYPQGWRQWGQDNGIPRYLQVYAATRGNGDDIWCSSYTYGLTWIGGGATYTTDDDSLVTFTTDSISSPPGLSQVIAPLINNQVTMLATQGTTLWAAQRLRWNDPPDYPSGILAVTGEPPALADMEFTAYQPSSGAMAAKNVIHLCPSGSDALWVVYAEDEGCQLLNHGGTPTDTSDDQWYPAGRAFGVEDGLASSTITCVECAPDGTAYAGTPLGLFSYDGSGTFSQVAGVSADITVLEVDDAGRVWANSSQGLIQVDDGEVTVFDQDNSPYLPSTREAAEEFATVGPDGQTVYLTSLNGLWSVSCGGGGTSGSGVPLFYPQPWRVDEEQLGLAGTGSDQPIEVELYALDGSYLCRVESQPGQPWSWDGSIDGGTISSGIYMALVSYGDGQAELLKLAVVR